MKMQAALWYGPEEMRVEEVEIPQINPDEVLIRIGAAMTCGTDFKLFRKGHPMLVKSIPAPFGHEMAGTIAEVGSQVRRFHVGDRVVAANSAPCGDCFFCHREQENLCENLEFLTGAYAEYIRVPAKIVQKNLYKIPAGLSFREAAVTEPLACAVHCIDKAIQRTDQTVCIIGAGPCGLFFVQLGKLYGLKVIVLGRGEEKLNVAKGLGADHIVSSLHEGYLERVKDLTQGNYGPDLVIEGAGQPATWELATRLVRKGGRVWFYGGCPRGTQVSLDTHKLHYQEVSMHGVFHHTPKYFEKSLSLIVEGKINVRPLIVGETKLKDLNQIFRKGAVENPLKIAVIP
ncbi:MAG: alcohol dehydrogenase catalytic domain-containing protein [Deltaproteobacteria bacterium]|nr:alcohol dehydrogenase catalytic domain-containing protein [Deltaproteobacteria bacterium]